MRNGFTDEQFDSGAIYEGSMLELATQPIDEIRKYWEIAEKEYGQFAN